MTSKTYNVNQFSMLKLFTEYMVALSMVIHCNSVYVAEYQAVLIGRVVILIFCVSMLILIGLSSNIGKIKRLDYLKYDLAFILYFSVLIIFRNANVGAVVGLSVELFLLWNYILLEGKTGVISILEKYKNLILSISVISLFFWILGSVFNFIEPTGQIYSTWTDNEAQLAVFKGYFGIHYETQIADMFDDAGMVRNTSIFTEAPMYSLHLSLALLIELFIGRKISKINALLLVLTIVTTMSSTGYVLSAGAVFIKLNIFLKDNERMKWFRYITFVLLLIVFINIVWDLFNYRAFTVSGIIRADDYLVAIETWISNPILGVGIGNYESIRLNMGAWRFFNTGYSNSIGIVLAQGGLWIFLPFLYLFYQSIIKNYFKGKYNVAGLSICFFFLICFAVGIEKFNMLCVLAYLVSYIRSDSGKKVIYLDK